MSGTYPINRGFDRHFGPIWGVVDYFDPFSLVEGTEPVRAVPEDFYMTDAITAKSVEYLRTMAKDDRPFFLYVAHTAPHWPLHARAEDIARYKGKYDGGWHALRESRAKRQVEMGLIDPATHPLPRLQGRGPDWETLDAARREHESALMATHAAMVDRVDQGVGSILQALKETGRDGNTMVVVLADNGASPERYLDPGFDRPSQTREGRPIRYAGAFVPGAETTWGYIGSYWASAANTPYRYWKAESYDGGCHTPMIVSWPAGLEAPKGSSIDRPGHVIDLMPTCLELAGAGYPGQFGGREIKPLEGESLVPSLKGHPRTSDRSLYFEHEGGRAMIAGEWKIVARAGQRWELYDLSRDATETRDLAAEQPERVLRMAPEWRVWARRVGAFIPPTDRDP